MRAWLPVLACVVLAGCPGRYDIDPIDAATPRDAPIAVDARGDAGGGDAGREDSGVIDAGAVDGGAIDSGTIDSGPADAGPPDSGPIDSGRIDAGPPDSGPPDSGPGDSGPRDSGIDARPSSDCLGTCTGPSMPRDPRECFSEAEAADLDLVRTTAEANGTMCPDGRSIIGFTLTRVGSCVRVPAFFCGA